MSKQETEQSNQKDGDGKFRFDLRQPIELKDGEKIDHLMLRELCAGDFENTPLEGLTWGHYLALGAKMSGQAPVLIKRMGVLDMNRMVDAINETLDPTGELKQRLTPGA